MKKLIEGYKEKGCKIIRSRGENPSLLIIGEEHFLRNYVSPEEVFLGIKPQYFFCEGVRSGLEIDFAGYQNLNIDMTTPVADESFERLVQIELYDLGSGIAGVAITKLFPQSPKTKFVGMDLAGETARGERIAELARDAIKNLDDHVAELLDLRGRELTDNQYRRHEALRDFLYKEKGESFLNAYEAAKNVEDIIKKAPRSALEKLGAKALFAKVMQDTEQLNAEREEIMARTMADYVSGLSGMNLAVTGAHHVRRSSHIYPILDKSTVSYVSIDVRSK